MSGGRINGVKEPVSQSSVCQRTYPCPQLGSNAPNINASRIGRLWGPLRLERMNANTTTDEILNTLDYLWGLATVEVINARTAYTEITSRSDDEDAAVAAAWLRLWRAEEHQRRVAAQFEA
jgi:hypothetical protein